MNASYKIVLLGAFLLFAAIVGYYIFSGDGQTPDELALNDEYPEADTPAVEEPDDRPRLDTYPPTVNRVPEPEPVVEPEPAIEETIGETPAELPDAPVLDPEIFDGPIAGADPSELERPTLESLYGRETEDPSTTEDITDPETLLRPELGEGDPLEETTEPEVEPEPQPEPEAEPAPRPAPPDPATIPRTYTVEAGDTFASIAKEYYGEERAWFDIAQANPSIDPKRLQVGQEIVLPNRDATVREREEVQPPAPGNDQTYAVRPGDNLSKIAKKFYGDAEQWELIYARNRQLIGQRPDALKVGMKLVIPQAYEGAE